MSATLIVLSALAAAASIASAVYTNEENKKATKQSQQWQEDMMNYQNQYNTPSEQLNRLKDAGINPASLGMGQGMSIQGNTSAGVDNPMIIPNVDPMGSASGNLFNLLSGIHQGELSITESNLREYRRQQVEAQTEQIKANTQLLNADASAQLLVNKYIEAEKVLALKNGESDLKLKRYERAHLEALTDNLQYQLYELMPAEKKKMLSEADRNILDLDFIQAQILSVEAQIEKTKSENQLVQAETNLTESQTMGQMARTALDEQQLGIASETFNKMMQVYDAQIKQMQAQTGLTEEQCFWYIFDEIDKNSSLHLMGSKIPYNRVGARKTRKYYENSINERYGSSIIRQ